MNKYRPGATLDELAHLVKIFIKILLGVIANLDVIIFKFVGERTGDFLGYINNSPHAEYLEYSLTK
jgi:hypothetical protein